MSLAYFGLPHAGLFGASVATETMGSAPWPQSLPPPLSSKDGIGFVKEAEILDLHRMLTLLWAQPLFNPFAEGQNIDVRLNDAKAFLFECRDSSHLVVGGLIALASRLPCLLGS
jgi:hypothetical protein